MTRTGHGVLVEGELTLERNGDRFLVEASAGTLRFHAPSLSALWRLARDSSVRGMLSGFERFLAHTGVRAVVMLKGKELIVLPLPPGMVGSWGESTRDADGVRTLLRVFRIPRTR